MDAGLGGGVGQGGAIRQGVDDPELWGIQDKHKDACDYTIAGERGKTGVGELAIHAKALRKWGLEIF
jgi:hypothetical protein